MRWAVPIVFLFVLCGAGFYRMAHLRTNPTLLIATHSLEPNHLIGLTDVALPPLKGRYVSRHINAHDPIEGLVDTPNLAAPAPGSILVAIPVDRLAVVNGTINQGTIVRLCRGPQPVATKPATFQVATVECPQSGTCSAFVEAPADQAAAFAAGPQVALSANPCS